MSTYAITIEDGQSLIDAAIQEYGDARGIILLIQDNEVNLADDLVAGSTLQVRLGPETGEVPSVARMNYFRERRIRVITDSGVVPGPLGDFNDDFADDFFN